MRKKPKYIITIATFSQALIALIWDTGKILKEKKNYPKKLNNWNIPQRNIQKNVENAGADFSGDKVNASFWILTHYF